MDYILLFEQTDPMIDYEYDTKKFKYTDNFRKKKDYSQQRSQRAGWEVTVPPLVYQTKNKRKNVFLAFSTLHN